MGAEDFTEVWCHVYLYRPSADWLGWRRVDVMACPVLCASFCRAPRFGRDAIANCRVWNIRQRSLLSDPWRRCLQPNFINTASRRCSAASRDFFRNSVFRRIEKLALARLDFVNLFICFFLSVFRILVL